MGEAVWYILQCLNFKGAYKIKNYMLSENLLPIPPNIIYPTHVTFILLECTIFSHPPFKWWMFGFAIIGMLYHVH